MRHDLKIKLGGNQFIITSIRIKNSIEKLNTFIHPETSCKEKVFVYRPQSLVVVTVKCFDFEHSFLKTLFLRRLNKFILGANYNRQPSLIYVQLLHCKVRVKLVSNT